VAVPERQSLESNGAANKTRLALPGSSEHRTANIRSADERPLGLDAGPATRSRHCSTCRSLRAVMSASAADWLNCCHSTSGQNRASRAAR